MRKIVVLCAVVFSAALVWAESCSCSAPDGSCSVQIQCPGTCWAICMNGGQCLSSCGKPPIGPGEAVSGADLKAALLQAVSVKADNATVVGFVRDITAGLPVELEYPPALNSTQFSLDLKGNRLIDVLRYVVSSFSIGILYDGFQVLPVRSEGGNGRFSLSVRGLSGKDFEMVLLLYLDEDVALDPARLYDIELKDATFAQLEPLVR